MEIKEREIIAAKGMEVYNISEPDICGHRIVLGVNDHISNWAERQETILEDELDPVFRSTRITKKEPGVKSWLRMIIEKIKKLIKSK